MTPRFDRVAPYYAWAEAATFGGLLQWCRTALLGQVADAKRALILGEGDGRFATAFLAANPVAMVEIVDASPVMVSLARRRVARVAHAVGRVRWHVTDALLADLPPGPHDLVVTNFFLDCFRERELATLMPRIAATMALGGCWLVGDFALPTGRFRRPLAWAALTTMYAVFGPATRIPAGRLPNLPPLLHAAGLHLEHSSTRLGGFLSSQIWRKPSL